MSGIVVFDDAPELAVVGGESQPSLIVSDNNLDVMVLDGDLDRSIVEVPSTEDFIVLDVPKSVAEVLEAEPALLLIDAPAVPATVVEEASGDPILVVQSGGRQGLQGPPGEPGLDGAGAYYVEFNFATPETIWTCVHNQDTFALSVETVDLYGDPIEGEIHYLPGGNTIEIHWYYPTSGTARVFR